MSAALRKFLAKIGAVELDETTRSNLIRERLHELIKIERQKPISRSIEETNLLWNDLNAVKNIEKLMEQNELKPWRSGR